jgi:hypothetical protein
VTRRERYSNRPNVIRQMFGMPMAPAPAPSDIGKAEVLKWLRNVETDPWYEQFPVPITTPAFNGLLGKTARWDVALGRIYADLRNVPVKRLAKLIGEIEGGSVVFWRVHVNTRGAPPYEAFRLTRPETALFRQTPLLDRCDYDWWARCKACGGRRFAPVVIAGREEAACFDCTPPQMYASIGAGRSTWAIIPEAIRLYGGVDSSHLALPKPKLPARV